MIVIVATEAEYKIARERFKEHPIIKTGVGGINVVQTLSEINKKCDVLNFGFVGSNLLPIGTEVKVAECKLYHPFVEYDEPTFKLNGDVLCYTSNDFVTFTDVKEPVVFDMELAYILAMGFRSVQSIKIVSDNLSFEEYKNITKER